MTKAVLEPTTATLDKASPIKADQKWYEKTTEAPESKNKIMQTINFSLGNFDDKNRTFQAIASTAMVDRQGDTIDQAGWDLDNFKNNPVIPWAHDYCELPVARAIEIGVVDGVLEFTYQAPPKGMSEFADTVWDFYRNKYLFAFSVGFIPKAIDGEPSWEGNDYTECELLEISAVVVPANAGALVLAYHMGDIDTKQTKTLISKLSSTIKNLQELVDLEEDKNDDSKVTVDESVAVKTVKTTEKVGDYETSSEETKLELTMNTLEKAIERVMTKLMADKVEKGAISSDLPLADKSVTWDSGEAVAAIKKWASDDDGNIDFGKYSKCFMWKDPDNADKQGGYKLPFADIIGGEPKAVWAAVKAIYGVLQGARGGVQIPEADKAAVLTQVKKYYKKFGEGTPGGDDDGKSLTDIQTTSDNENMAETKATPNGTEHATNPLGTVKAVVDALTDTSSVLKAHSKALSDHAETMNAHATLVQQKADYLLDTVDAIKSLLSPVNQGDESSENENDTADYNRGDGQEPPENDKLPKSNATAGSTANNNDGVNDAGKSAVADTEKSLSKPETKGADEAEGEVNSDGNAESEGADQEAETASEEATADVGAETDSTDVGNDEEEEELVDPDNLTEEQQSKLMQGVIEKLNAKSE